MKYITVIIKSNYVIYFKTELVLHKLIYLLKNIISKCVNKYPKLIERRIKVLNRKEFMERLLHKFNLAVDKLGLFDSEPLKRYLTEEYIELLVGALLGEGLYDIDVKLYTSYEDFDSRELCYVNCITDSRTVERTITLVDNVTDDSDGKSISRGVTKHRMVGDKDDVNIIVYVSVDSMVFNFYEEVLVMYIPQKLVNKLCSSHDPFMRIVK